MALRLYEQKQTPRTSHKKKPCRSRTYSRLKRACGSILEDPDLTKEKIKYVTVAEPANGAGKPIAIETGDQNHVDTGCLLL